MSPSFTYSHSAKDIDRYQKKTFYYSLLNTVGVSSHLPHLAHQYQTHKKRGAPMQSFVSENLSNSIRLTIKQKLYHTEENENAAKGKRRVDMNLELVPPAKQSLYKN
jgi:hypothetical protein